MVQAWWQAHALEFVITAVLIVLGWIFWLGDALSSAFAERRKKKEDGIL